MELLDDYAEFVWQAPRVPSTQAVASAAAALDQINAGTALDEPLAPDALMAAVWGAGLADAPEVASQVLAQSCAALARRVAGLGAPAWVSWFTRMAGIHVEVTPDTVLVPARVVLASTRSFGDMDKLADMPITPLGVRATLDVRAALAMSVLMTRIPPSLPALTGEARVRLVPAKAAAKRIKSKRNARVRDLQRVGYVEGSLPPCIRQMESRIAAGALPEHTVNFCLAAFHNCIGTPAEALESLYRNVGGFDPGKTHYQLNHVYTHKTAGSGHYLPHNCATLKLHGLCPANNDCADPKNPLGEYRRRLRRDGHIRRGRVHRPA